MNLEPSHHPLEDVVKKYKDQIDFSRIYLHPYLPFAILDGRKGSLCVSWNKDEKSAPHLVLSDGEDYSFSHDGKWVTYKTSNIGKQSQTYLMPVSEKYPHYLGSPILLANDYFNEGKFAWTSNPTGFVGSSNDKIYHWDLVNRDYPGKGKMSFHDYIVQQDLDKLTKEKKQGLGRKH